MLSRVSIRALPVRGGIRCFSNSTLLKQKDIIEAVDYSGAEIISGAPKELITKRCVRIYQEAKPATQSGTFGTRNWKLDWDILGKGNRWENDLMGYQGSADYMQGTIMKFDTKESAIRFAENQSWDYYIQEPKKRHFRKKDYSANFYHSAGPLKHIRTK
ncbi:NdufS4 [[Candida] subhashii]|uniref:NADH dehydrogenase [ubiquinone] iron-sulfur protein 4, mitochondrial n=1 Tax=[Candida] subhashii TaxID=561895 RepID=A0A8J5QN98_9ASCO|nr:NdufS4 [[Candida] subhashii]KAG7661375.1 NdufS4 [[Candida] subhashii]